MEEEFTRTCQKSSLLAYMQGELANSGWMIDVHTLNSVSTLQLLNIGQQGEGCTAAVATKLPRCRWQNLRKKKLPRGSS